MGEVNGTKGAWGYVKGGMGKVSTVIAEVAQEAGAEIMVNADAKRILITGGKVSGVYLSSGSIIECDHILSNADPGSTMLGLLQNNELPTDVRTHFTRSWQCEPACTKVRNYLLKSPGLYSRPNALDKYCSGQSARFYVPAKQKK
nr:oxidoreductase putative [Albugo laibachii Nc14]|eukprot:CCA21862.1 oxidoreductase putative [Albugo laibachii Nc14]